MLAEGFCIRGEKATCATVSPTGVPVLAEGEKASPPWPLRKRVAMCPTDGHHFTGCLFAAQLEGLNLSSNAINS